MERTVLILGSSGRFGRHASKAFQAADWEVRHFDRKQDNLWDAAWGASVIVNAWNPLYPDWATDIPQLHAQVVEVAKASKATVLIPGNIYNYGPDMPEVLSVSTPHNTQRQLGVLRKEMENAYRDAGIKTIILRAGDFIDTEASGNWFYNVITKPLKRAHIRYPGPLDIRHAWAYLPDMAKAAVMLAERRAALPVFADILFEGFTFTGHELAKHLSAVMDRNIVAKRMSWLPIQIAQPFWPMARYLLQMRYLWNVPHHLDGRELTRLCPEFRPTNPQDALQQALPMDVHPNQPMTPSGHAIGT